jgi:hypothetical protein
MIRKQLKEDVSEDDLTELQKSIIQIATKNPELSHTKIAERTGASASYVSTVHNDKIDEKLIPELVTPDDLDDDLYESIVAGIEAMGDAVRVEKRYDLDLSQGDSKEVDVAVWLESGNHDILLIIECKYHDEPVNQETVSGMARNVQNSAAHKAILISKSGFQSGAISQARDGGIGLFTLRKLKDGDLDDRVSTINLTITVQPHTGQITDLGLHPVDEEPSSDDLSDAVEQNPELYTLDQQFANETIWDRLRDATAQRPVGTYTEDIEDRMMLLNGVYYRLDAMAFEVRKGDPVIREYVIDGYDEYDLYMRDELADDDENIRLYSTERALETFVSNVDSN